jgi:hypothetical protein
VVDVPCGLVSPHPKKLKKKKKTATMLVLLVKENKLESSIITYHFILDYNAVQFMHENILVHDT